MSTIMIGLLVVLIPAVLVAAVTGVVAIVRNINGANLKGASAMNDRTIVSWFQLYGTIEEYDAEEGVIRTEEGHVFAYVNPGLSPGSRITWRMNEGWMTDPVTGEKVEFLAHITDVELA